MIEWTGPNQKTLRKTLLSFYRSNQVLRLFVSDHFEYALDDLPDTEVSRTSWAAALLEQAVAEGWINELYATFCLKHQDDPRIIKLRKDLNDSALETPIGGPEASNAIVRVKPKEELVEEPGSAHLVVAIFWREREKRTVRIHPKLYYRDLGSRSLVQESLMQDECAIELKTFPSVLNGLVNFTNRKLYRLFSSSGHPWKLAIELFVPVDLLWQPLSTWHGQNNDLVTSYPIVLGCSDRFDPDQEKSVEWYNQLQRGWKRFQSTVPDQAGSTLRNLNWLQSNRARQEAFEQYSGFQCYGHWLKPDEQDNWQRLVRSGIPLALWMCEGKPRRTTITTVFEQLTDGTRFEFLDRIPLIRDQQQRTSGYCVGVFYEDPTYIPDIPLPEEEQFFVWPGA